MKQACLALWIGLGSVALFAQEPPPAQQGAAATQAPSQPTQRVFTRGNFQGASGVITEIKDEQIKLKSGTDEAVTVKLSSKTQYRKDRQPARLVDFKVGDFVIVRGQPAGESAFAADTVMQVAQGAVFGGRMPGGNGAMTLAGANPADLGKTFLVGSVKAIDGAKITLHRPDNQDQTIEADENTSFKRSSESITLPEIKLGDTIMARGELKNGVFVPAMVSVLDPQTMQTRRTESTPHQPPPQ